VLGVIYEGLSNVRWTRYPGATFEFSIRDLAPGETLTLPRQRFLINAASWQDVQKAALKNEPSGLPTHPREIVHAETPMFSDAPSAGFRFRRMIAVPIEGKASLKFPGGECVEAAVEKWTLDAPIEIGMPDLPEHVRGLQAVEYRMWSDRMERSGRLPLFVPVRGSSVQITQSHEGEYDYFRVRNGCIDFRVAPKFNGVLYWLSEETNPETNLLKTPFPKPGMWTWINPWFGGIGIAPSLGFRFHHSSFDGDAIKLEWNGYKWEGVRVKIKPVKQWQSLEIESLYLTRPGVPVIVNLVRLTENGGCRRSFNVECVSFACPSGDPDAKTEAIIDEWGSRVKLERSERGSESGENPWMAVYDPATRKTFGAAISRGGVYAWEAAEAGIPIWGSTRVTTCPGKTVEFAILYAIADDPELIPILAEPVRHWDRIIAG
jgi:hypothetical protein